MGDFVKNATKSWADSERTSLALRDAFSQLVTWDVIDVEFLSDFCDTVIRDIQQRNQFTTVAKPAVAQLIHEFWRVATHDSMFDELKNCIDIWNEVCIEKKNYF